MSTKYFDHNATTPLSAAARAAWIETAERFWHNPSSLYPEAGAAKRRLEDAREALAELLGLEDEGRIVFTSGATEANNAVLAHLASASPERRCAISATEHPSALAPARRHFHGRRLVEVPVDSDGSLCVDHLESEMRRGDLETVVVMAANNETGVVQDYPAVSDLARENGAICVCDASQWFGKRPTAHASTFGDVVVGSGHKFGAPKGVGFVVLGGRAKSVRLQCGGPQESGHRAGTEDLAGIVAMVAALAEAETKLELHAVQAGWRDAFAADLQERIPGTRALALGVERLANTVMLVMPEGRNLKWLTRLGRRGFAVSTGSACSSGAESGSHVLAAMGLETGEIDRALRVSSGFEHRREDWFALADACVEVWGELNESGGRPDKPTLDLSAL